MVDALAGLRRPDASSSTPGDGGVQLALLQRRNFLPRHFGLGGWFSGQLRQSDGLGGHSPASLDGPDDPLAQAQRLPPEVMVEAVVDALSTTGERARLTSLALLQRLAERSSSVADALLRNLSADQRYHLLMHMLLIVGRNVLGDFALRSRLFEGAEKMGLHVLPAHFYSPVPILSELEDSAWQPYDLTGLDWRPEEQRELLMRLGRWASEVQEFSHDRPSSNGRFFFNNSAISPFDAAVYYAMLRELKPRRVLEVGGGYSTMLAAEAARRNGSTVLDCIEPYPMDDLRRLPGLRRLLERGVQTVPIEEFTTLEAGDVLFIDCSHVSKIGSDVNHLVLRVLPRLAPGVIVHIHDMFVPQEYPKRWVKDLQLFWSEQYVVHAFLLFNSEYRVLLANYFMGTTFRDVVAQAFPLAATTDGVSLWLQRKLSPR